MQDVKLYFLSDQYFIDFPDKYLQRNKDPVNGVPHDRPYFMAFDDPEIPQIRWVIPISSKVEKYRELYDASMSKRGRCDTIRFGKVFGRDCAFLIQNMCPATDSYMTLYKDKKGNPVTVDVRYVNDIVGCARSVLNMAKHGMNLVFPDVFKIYEGLKKKLDEGT